MCTSEMLAVTSDNHARPELIYGVDRFYGGDVKQALLGDLWNGRGSTRTAMQAAVDVGAMMLLGNNEWYFLGAALEIDDERRYDFATCTWNNTHEQVIESYGGIYPPNPTPVNALRLWDKMPESHKKLLVEAELFYEENDFLLVHAGLTSDDWATQRRSLENWQQERQDDNRYVVDGEYIPSQLRGDEYLGDENVVLSGLGRLLVNGHYHRQFTTFGDRLSTDKNRLYLATDKRDDFALVWESWTGNLLRIAADGTLIDMDSGTLSSKGMTDNISVY